MNEAVSIDPGAYTQIRLREPAGERTFQGSVTVGSESAQVLVPGAAPLALRIERRDRVWIVEPLAAGAAWLDARALEEPRELRRGDVLQVGDAHVTVVDLTRTLLRIEVAHLAGNDTITPAGAVTDLAEAGATDDADIEIRAREPLPVGSPGAAPSPRAAAPTRRAARAPREPLVATLRRHAWLVAAAVAMLVIVVVLVLLEPVVLDVQPAAARIRTPGTLIALPSGGRLLVLPGTHVVRGELQGYDPAEARVDVRRGDAAVARLRLARQPGVLAIGTSGVAAAVLVDGAESGRAPGDLRLAPGPHTITLRAPRYLDFVASVDVEGAGVRQRLDARLQPNWGTLQVASNPPGASLSVDGKASGATPASLQVDAGVRRLELAAPGLKAWTGTVAVRAGETLKIGPVTLGQPDARLVVRSQPAGADVTVTGTFRGRAPAEVGLSPGIAHEVIVSLPGYAPWTQSVFADPGKRIAIDARLVPVVAAVTMRGEPADAEIIVDGAPRGRAPVTLQLNAIEHRIEVRKAGFLPFVTTVTPEKGLERIVAYRLTSADRATALRDSAPTITAKAIAYTLVIVPTGTFAMGSDRREQGRRPNESLKKVTLARPFYIGTTEVTNGQFRKFRADHASGYVGKRTLDLDNHPVTQVSWSDAAEFCNWLSEQEGLPPAYEKHEGKWVLKRPVTTGYRLPTEAEWEFAARYAGPGRFLRFGWGDALPVSGTPGNLAGAEAGEESESGTLAGYRDEYPVVAPVGKFPASALGLHDVTGNVSEWVNDYYSSFVDDTAATDPLGPDQGARHVFRGANWRTASVSELRLAWRDASEDGGQTIGFRIARYAEAVPGENVR